MEKPVSIRMQREILQARPRLGEFITEKLDMVMAELYRNNRDVNTGNIKNRLMI